MTYVTRPNSGGQIEWETWRKTCDNGYKYLITSVYTTALRFLAVTDALKQFTEWKDTRRGEGKANRWFVIMSDRTQTGLRSGTRFSK